MHVVVVMMATALFSGCFSSQKPYSGNGEWNAARTSVKSVVVMRPVVSTGYVDGEGTLKLDADLAAVVRRKTQRNVQKVIQKKLKDAAVRELPFESAATPEMEAAHAAFEDVNRYIIGHSYALAPGKISRARATLGSALHDAGIDADVAVFVWAEDVRVDGSYVAKKIGEDVARAALGSSGERPIRSPPSSSEYPRGISAAIVQVSSGAILWFNYDEYRFSMDLHKSSDNKRFINDLLQWL